MQLTCSWHAERARVAKAPPRRKAPFLRFFADDQFFVWTSGPEPEAITFASPSKPSTSSITSSGAASGGKRALAAAASSAVTSQLPVDPFKENIFIPPPKRCLFQNDRESRAADVIFRGALSRNPYSAPYSAGIAFSGTRSPPNWTIRIVGTSSLPETRSRNFAGRYARSRNMRSWSEYSRTTPICFPW